MAKSKAGIDLPAPFIQPLFDKSRLTKDEFKHYIYEIVFKKSAKTVRDMSLAGYIHAASPYIKGIESEVVHYGTVGERKIMCAVIKCTVTFCCEDKELKFTALADGDVTNVPSSDTLIRTVETRALKRAIARALDLSKVDMNENFIDEEEIGTPLNHDGDSSGAENAHKPAFRKSPVDIAEEKRQKAIKAEEDAERQSDDDENEARKADNW
jgi:hypothetical protein